MYCRKKYNMIDPPGIPGGFSNYYWKNQENRPDALYILFTIL